MSDEQNSIPKLKGFAALSPEQRKLIASAGGKAVRPENRAFAQDRELAINAGRKGGALGKGGGRPKQGVISDD